MEPVVIQCKLKVGFVSGVYAAKQGIMFNLLSLLRLSTWLTLFYLIGVVIA